MQATQIESAPPASQALDYPDLESLAMTLRVSGQPTAIFRAVHAVAARAIGARLFTIMSYDARRHEVERVYTNMPEVYPSGGRKQKRGTAWSKRILEDLEPFRAETAQGIRDAFDDHAVITGMGLGSILNIPIAYDGVCVGTMNMTHVEGWYTREHEAMGLMLGSFLAPALLARQPARADRVASL
jgi:hypothetical protein